MPATKLLPAIDHRNLTLICAKICLTVSLRANNDRSSPASHRSIPTSSPRSRCNTSATLDGTFTVFDRQRPISNLLTWIGWVSGCDWKLARGWERCINAKRSSWSCCKLRSSRRWGGFLELNRLERVFDHRLEIFLPPFEACTTTSLYKLRPRWIRPNKEGWKNELFSSN